MGAGSGALPSTKPSTTPTIVVTAPTKVVIPNIGISGIADIVPEPVGREEVAADSPIIPVAEEPIPIGIAGFGLKPMPSA